MNISNLTVRVCIVFGILVISLSIFYALVIKNIQDKQDHQELFKACMADDLTIAFKRNCYELLK